MWTIKSALSSLKSDLDTLGDRGKEALAAELAAEVRRREVAKQAALQLSIEEQRRAERTVLAALLDHPLPLSAASLAVGGPDSAPQLEVEPMQVEGEAGLGGAAPMDQGHATSGGALSRPA